MTSIKNIQDFKEAINHPYRMSEYFTDETNVYSVSDDINEVEALIECTEGLLYCILWEGNLADEDGNKIQPVYGDDCSHLN